MTRNTTMKRTQDQVAEMENEGQGQQQEATPPEVGVGVTVARTSSSPATDAATDQDVDTAAVGLDELAEQQSPSSPSAWTIRARRGVLRATVSACSPAMVAPGDAPLPFFERQQGRTLLWPRACPRARHGD